MKTINYKEKALSRFTSPLAEHMMTLRSDDTRYKQLLEYIQSDSVADHIAHSLSDCNVTTLLNFVYSRGNEPVQKSVEEYFRRYSRRKDGE